MQTFGTAFFLECDITLTVNYDYSEPYIYELYIVDTSGSYFDVPVAISGYEHDGVSVDDPSNWDTLAFLRRFFLKDEASGYSLEEGMTKAVRFAREVKLFFEIAETGGLTKIRRPFLWIEYGSKRSVDLDEKPRVTVSFKTSYTTDTSGFWTGAYIFFGCFQVGIILSIVLRMYIWYQNHPKNIIKSGFVSLMALQTVFVTLRTWGFTMFFFLLGCCFYWFAFFKLPTSSFKVMPSAAEKPEEYIPFYVMFFLSGICIVLSFCEIIWRQTKLDYFFIDWEKPEPFKTIKGEKNGVSAWRSLFACNEFSELQISRLVPSEFVFLVFSVIMITLKVENATMLTPSMSLDNENIEYNFVLMYFISCFFLLLLYLVYWAGRWVASYFFPLPTQEFVDFLSVTNISVVIFDGLFHGYYIHGKSPSGRADGDKEDIQNALIKEIEGTVPKRGLVPGDTLQTFEIWLPEPLRQEYKNLVDAIDRLGKEAPKKRRNAQRPGESVQGPNEERQALTGDELNSQKRRLADFFKNIVDEIEKGTKRPHVSQFPQKAFRIPPRPLTEITEVLFENDTTYNFAQTMLCGHELKLFIVEIMVFLMIDFITSSLIISLILTFLVIQFLSHVRKNSGQSNLSKKTYIDERFLS